jgi:hypothetical protein
MAKTLLAICVLVALFFRDLRLLVAAGRSRIATACAVYVILVFLYAVALGSWLGLAHISDAQSDDDRWADLGGHCSRARCSLRSYLVAVPRGHIPPRMAGRSCAFSGRITLPLLSDGRVAREDRDQPGIAQSAAVQPDLDRVDSALRIRASASASQRSLPLASIVTLRRTSELVVPALFRDQFNV